MLKIENVDIFGWNAAIRGLRNPMNSWDKSDMAWVNDGKEWESVPAIDFDFDMGTKRIIGENNLKLMKKLSKAGNDHAKFLRMINVTCDITAPLYWWKEHDQYKVGTTTNSCSTMHKIHAKEFTLDDFSHEHLSPWNETVLSNIIAELNTSRDQYLRTKNKDDWWQMIQLLPSSYNQRRTVQLNYQVLKSMYFARKDHKLDEWHTLCDWMLTLPYFKEICVEN